MIPQANQAWRAAAGALLAGAGIGAAAQEVSISPQQEAAFAKIAAAPAVKQALDFLKQDDAKTLEDQKAIVVIAAPTFKEKRRAEYYLGRLKEAGLNEVRMDAASNVCGVLPGAGGGPKLLLSAHLDTVFPENTNLTIRENGGKLYAPGIADDARGLASILSLVRAFKASGLRTVGDVWLCGTVGEEGLGDLKGIKQVFKDHKDIDGYIALESPTVPNEEISFQAAGSNRYRITYKGPGGHSYQAFGQPSAIHALGRAIAGISELQTPATPKTTFTVGTIAGGTSVNSIAAEATMDLDMRSNDNDELLKLEAKALQIAKDAAAAENKRWNSDKIKVDIEQVGARPGGSPSPNHAVVQSLWLAVKAIGATPKLAGARSTEANLPISLGIPAAVVGAGGFSQGIHSPEEWFDPANAHLGPAKALMAILGLAGVQGVSDPLLAKRPPRQ
ncbi:Acetylornithine deacetylase/Succinyl-diaminopimelate desuccinylase [Noviherbaspirillum humi]|uniref:Acetylornithine deacetylase/Succinyl-diaminopimelate desuccinylase n=1 Tax=Noviherbaspirillum humi TaxID=1688639 RepID=A0A239IR04_9BURK|nr:M20/M25/M40 family metallo-hydrolase [Noviherbaspirillum humi]SNS95999.1 Acetylornithine deacetylase/Succinyl-diaminopimelate desuccinylase [Noviherbaspirillum humi]